MKDIRNKFSVFLQEDFAFFLSTLQSFFLNKKNQKYFLIIFVIYLVGYFALLRADIYYIDDIRRAVDGQAAREHFSRYLANILFELVNFSYLRSSNITDFSPFSQLLGLAFVSFSSLVLVRVFGDESESNVSLPLLCASSFLGLSPYFLECISYKFDAFTMSIALFSSIFPFLFVKNMRVFFVTSLLSLLVMYTTYQAASAVFIMTALFVLLKYYLDDVSWKRLWYMGFCMMGSFLIVTLLYKLFLVRAIDIYVSSHSLPLDQIMSGSVKNLFAYFSRIYEDFSHTIFFWMFVLIHVLLFVNILLYKKKSPRIFGIFFLVPLVFFVTFLGSYGPYTILAKPLFAPRAFYGFALYLALLGVFLIRYSAKRTFRLSQIVVFGFLLQLVVIANTYGNALSAQQKYFTFRTRAVLQDINTMADGNSAVSVHFSGEEVAFELHPVSQSATKTFPVIRRLIPHFIGAWGGYFEPFYYNHYVNFTVVNSCGKDNLRPVKTLDTPLHTIEQYSHNCFDVHYKKQF